MAERRGFVGGFLIGALVGAAAAIVLTPEGGALARQLLEAKAREASDLLAGPTGSMRERVSSLASGLQAGAGEMYARGRAMVEEARSNVDAAIEEGRAAAQSTRSEMERTERNT